MGKRKRNVASVERTTVGETEVTLVEFAQGLVKETRKTKQLIGKERGWEG